MILTNIPYFIQVSHIHVQMKSQILSNNLDCIYHLRILVFLFFLPLFCSLMMVYVGSCKMVCIVDLGIVISFQLVFLLSLFFLVHFLSISIPVLFLGIFYFQV